MRQNRTASSRVVDKVLIDQTLQGNTEAFGELVRKYQDRLYNAILPIAGCPTETEDIVQEAFYRAFVKLKEFRQGCAFYTWLYRIAANLAISYLRHREKVMSLDVRCEHGACEPIDQSELPEDELMREERGPLITAAFAQLSEDYRTILVLRAIERFDYATIAATLRVKIGTVRSRLHRARMQMRKLLEVAA